MSAVPYKLRIRSSANGNAANPRSGFYALEAVLGAAMLLMVFLFIVQMIATLHSQLQTQTDATTISMGVAQETEIPVGTSVQRRPTGTGNVATIQYGQHYVLVHVKNSDGSSAVRVLPRGKP